jgi:DNA-binding GntR family transcriptional regulator
MNLEIYEEIKNRILFLQYAPGQILNEKKLADEFGVSRTPLREVLYKLEWDNLVTIMPRAGAMVTLVEFQKLREVFQVRINIEGLIGSLAAERITDNQLRQIQKIQDECKRLTAHENIKELINKDIKFREILNNSVENVSLKEISDYLYNQTLRVWYMVFDRNNFSVEIEEEIKEIEKTIEVLSKRDPREVEKFRRDVIINYVARIRSKF